MIVEDVDRPTYERPWFVLGAVVLAVAVGLLLQWWGDSGSVEVVTDADPTPAAGEGRVPVTSGPPDPDGEGGGCPSAGTDVDPEAAQVLVEFMAAAATPGGDDDVPMTRPVRDAVEGPAPAPAVERMTRIGTFGADESRIFACVESRWQGPNGPRRSLDLVWVTLGGEQVLDEATTPTIAGEDDPWAIAGSGSDDGAGQDDGDPDEQEDDEADAPAFDDDEWVVSDWLRGRPETPTDERAGTVALLDVTSPCGRPDRLTGVEVPTGDPSARLRRLLEELASGPTGRATEAVSQVPADLQVLDATVEGTTARVVLEPTSVGLTYCEGVAAFRQVEATARGVLVETRPPVDPTTGGRDGVDDEDYGTVVVVIGGVEVDSLRA